MPSAERPDDRLIVALDYPDKDRALQLLDRLGDRCGWYKIGLELFSACGPRIVEEVRGRGKRVFLDLKLHDIPETVARAVAAVAPLQAELLTVHAGGGAEMLRRAREAAPPGLRLLAVTVLTSLDLPDLREVGVSAPSIADLVVQRALLAQRAGIDGVVASPREVPRLRQACGNGLLLVTPGVRSASTADDQKRTGSARQALADGADRVVVGRPIRDAQDPRAALLALLLEMGPA